MFDLPGICDEQRSITGAVVKKLDGALHEIGGSADVVVGNISTCFISGELEVSVGSAFVARIQLIVPIITAKAERMVAHGLAERVADTVGSVGLIEIQPVVADRKAVEQEHRQ